MLINYAVAESPQDVLWQKCLFTIEKKIGSSSFETWFRTTSLSHTIEGTPCVEVPNQFFADFIEEHFAPLIRETLSTHGGENAALLFVPTKKEWQIVEPIVTTLSEMRTSAIPSRVDQKGQFHPNYTFEKFVVGTSNHIAHAACLAVAEAPGKTSFNPLTIYGGTGLGKTHLLQAIGHFAQTEDTAKKVVYMTSQEFINQYINYVKDKKDSASFYKQFADTDLLLIDDIQFFSGKPGTQKEFYRIFNRLLLQNSQIVLSSDRPPEKIPDMMDHIINRFLGGLITDIQPPNLETRTAIISKKAEIDGLKLPDEVIQYIASQNTSNVREIEGTLIKLMASSAFTGKDITIEVAQEIFGDVISRKDQRITVKFIQEKVAQRFNISPNQLTAHTRKRDVTIPRNIAMYLSKECTKQSLRTIGLEFGGRDYTTVVHACKKIEQEILTIPEIADHIKALVFCIAPQNG
jgi:chromosomal replication initiator protein